MKSLTFVPAARKRFVLAAIVWVGASLAIHHVVVIPDDAIRLTAIFVLVYWFPGILTAELAGLRSRWSRTQFLALSGGIGLTEALLLGQVAVALGIPALALADCILLLAAGKITWLAKHSALPEQKRSKLDGGTIILITLGMIGVMNLIRVHRHAPVYTWWPSDSWHYLQVQAQFSDNPGQLNIQEGITAPGINRRLLWSSWLYNRAMLVEVARVDPVVAQQRDGTYAVYLFMVVAYVASGRELLQDRQAGWLAAFLQFGIIAHSAFEFLLRAQEDKFFSLYVFMPLVYMVLLRVMRATHSRDFALFVVLTVGMALIHPFNPVALFLTAVPFVLLRWVSDRQTVKRTLAVVGWMTALLVYPVLAQIALSSDSYVAAGMVNSRAVDWGYALTGYWNYALQQPEYFSAVLLLLIVLIATLRSRRDAGAQFLLAVSSTIILLLWIPPFAALGALIVTRTQNWRLFMLLPVGYAGMAGAASMGKGGPFSATVWRNRKRGAPTVGKRCLAGACAGVGLAGSYGLCGLVQARRAISY